MKINFRQKIGFPENIGCPNWVPNLGTIFGYLKQNTDRFILQVKVAFPSATNRQKKDCSINCGPVQYE